MSATTTTTKRGTAATTRLRKVECPSCGCICRMSRKALTTSGAPTCGCGTPMVPEAIEDAALCLEDGELRVHPDYAGELDRRIGPEVKVGPKSGDGRPRCGDCHAFRSMKGACRSCGSLRRPDTSYMSARASRMLDHSMGASAVVDHRGYGDDLPF